MSKGYDATGRITACGGNSMLCEDLDFDRTAKCEECGGHGWVRVSRTEFETMMRRWIKKGLQHPTFIKHAKKLFDSKHGVVCDKCKGSGEVI
jgi:RecJ-like exonuclease